MKSSQSQPPQPNTALPDASPREVLLSNLCELEAILRIQSSEKRCIEAINVLTGEVRDIILDILLPEDQLKGVVSLRDLKVAKMVEVLDEEVISQINDFVQEMIKRIKDYSSHH